MSRSHRGLAGRLGISLQHADAGEPVWVKGDPTFSEQALSNLVGNALSHNHAGGHVAVVLDAESAAFVLRVLDDGPGIREEDRARVLLRGQRGEGARLRTPAGRGLGQSIVDRVAALQRWRLQLKISEEGGLVAELRGQRLDRADGGGSDAQGHCWGHALCCIR